MLISILTINYNYGRYLPAALASAAAQTHEDLQFVLVDDGSDERTLEIISGQLETYRSRFAELCIKCLPSNRGKIAALNVAAPLLKGEFVVILDADDELEPEYVTHTLDVLLASRRRNDRVGFVYTDCTLIDAESKVLCRGLSCPFDREKVFHKSYIPECALTDVGALKAVVPLAEEVRVGTKHLKWKRIVRDGWEGVYSPVPLFRYRMHDCNLSGIGKRIRADLDRECLAEPILSGYWPVSEGVAEGAAPRVVKMVGP